MKKQKLLKIISLALIVAALAAAVLPLHIHAQECEHEFGEWLPHVILVSLIHDRECKKCGAVQWDFHNYGEPVWVDGTPGHWTRTCPICSCVVEIEDANLPATIHFVTNGGSNVKDYVGSLYDLVDLSAFKPAKPGYVFEGWYNNAGLTSEAIDPLFLLSSELTLYAKYSVAESTDSSAPSSVPFFPLPILPPNPNYSTLNFSANGGAAIDPITLPTGTTVQLEQYVPVRDGYEFKGWCRDEALTRTVTKVQVIDPNTVVYARWSPVG